MLSFSSGCTQEDKNSYPCFYNGLCKCRNGIFDLLCIKQILSSIFSAFFLVMGNSISSKENNTLMLGSLRWENYFQSIATLTKLANCLLWWKRSIDLWMLCRKWQRDTWSFSVTFTLCWDIDCNQEMAFFLLILFPFARIYFLFWFFFN